MALINVYTGIGSEHDAFYAQDTVRGSLSGYNFDEYVLLRSGERITPDTPLSDDDIVFMRRIPEGVTTAAIVMGVVGVLGAVGAGVYSYIQTKRQQKFAQELEESQKAASASSSSKLPFIRGAANQGATSQSLPYVIGHTLFTPYRLCPAFISIDGKYGEHQNYKMVLECGTSPLIIRRMNLGKQTVFTDDTDTPQNAVIGLSNGAFTSSASIMEIRNTGDFETPELNLKTSCTMYSDEIPHRHTGEGDDADTIAGIEKEWRAGIVKQCPDNTMAVEVFVLFNGCRKFSGDTWAQQTVTLIPQWTDADNPGDPYDAQNPGVWNDFDTAFQQPSGTNVRKQAVTAYFSVSANFSSYQGNDEATARSIIRSRWSSKIQRTPGIYIDPEAHKQYKFYIDPSVPWDNAKVTDVRFETRTVEHRTKGTTTYYWDIVFCFQFDGDVLTTGPSNTFTYNYGKEMRFVARQEFTAAQAYGKHITVRLVRTTPKADGTAQDTVHLLAVQTECYNPDKSDSNTLVRDKIIDDTIRDKSTRLGLVMEATDTVKDVLDSISIEAQGCARVWDGTSWSPSRVPTRNLAAWVLEILTSPIHEPSRYADTELDLESFGAWYEYCEDEGFCADGVITSAAKKSEILSTLLANGNAALLINQLTGLLEIAIDNGRDYPVALLTADNIISMSAVKEFKRLEDGMRVSYVNRDAEFAADTVLFMRDGGEYDPATDTLSQISLSYITDYLHAYKYVWRKQAEQIVRPLKATVQVGQYGSYYPVFSKILLQHRALAQGLGNATISGLVFNQGILAEIQLYGSVDFPEGNPVCGVTINCTYGPGVLALKVTGSGRTSSLTVIDGISSSSAVMPRSGDTLAFGTLDGDGEFTLVATPMLITGSDPTEEGWQLTLVEYNEELYEYGQMPAYKSHVTLSADNSSELDTSRMETENTAVNAALEAVSDSVASIIDGTSTEVGNPDTVTGLTAVATESGVILTWNAIGGGLANSLKEYIIAFSSDSGTTWNYAYAKAQNNSYTRRFASSEFFEVSDLQTWRFNVKAVNLYGLESENWSDGNLGKFVTTTGYGTWNLNAPNVTQRVNDRSVKLVFAQPASQLKEYGNIRYRVFVRKPDTDAQNSWYTPATTSDPYASESNYKDTSTNAGLLGDSVYVQCMPLTGQGTNNIVDTAYQFRIYAENEKGRSTGCTDITVTATCTNIQDLVKANETAKSAYISMLSAISANIGVIKQGAMTGDDYNYWALSDVTDDLGHRRRQGAFRVGGENQYLMVTPVENASGEIVDYVISLKAGTIEFSGSLGSSATVEAGTYIYSSDGKMRMELAGSGILMQKLIDGTWTLLGQCTVDEHNNMIVSNTNVKFGTILTQSHNVYHFDSTVLDGNGTDSENLALDVANVKHDPSIAPLNPGSDTGFYDGTIAKPLSGLSGRTVVAFSKALNINVGDNAVVIEPDSFASLCNQYVSDNYEYMGFDEQPDEDLFL